MYKADDPATNALALSKPFSKLAKGAYTIPGLGEVAIGDR